MAKTVLITGGAKRIGRELALSLASAAYNIALHYSSSAEEAEKTAEEIRGRGVECQTFQCDLREERELLELVPRVAGRMPELEVLINSASIFRKGAIAETGPEFFDSHLAINLKAPFFLSRDFAKLCRRGQIINLLDTRVARNDYGYAAYTLAKKALLELTRLSAREFAPGIRVNAVAPGLILPPEGGSKEAFEKMAGKIPLRKTGGPLDVLRAVEYLLKADFLTGQVIYVDGGEHLE